jgi:hypothetical protein
MSANAGEHGGFKEIIARISGVNVYSKLKFESGPCFCVVSDHLGIPPPYWWGYG